MKPIVDAAARLRNNHAISFLLIGDGKRKQEVVRRCASDGLHNVVMLPYVPQEQLPTSLAAADLALVSLRPQMEGLVLPSKLYGIMAAGVPIVAVGCENGELARVIRRADCGCVVQNGEQLAAAIAGLQGQEQKRRRMGRNAKKYFAQNYGRDRSIGKYRSLIEELAAG
jgi:glycosyltransferase involved in cell wall biosynthesis